MQASPHRFFPRIGLEIHVQLNTATKLFSGAPVKFADRPNTNVAYFDFATPGTLPFLNKRSVELGIVTGILLQGEISRDVVFDRKHYFYHDLPHGFQITQHRRPLIKNGLLQIQTSPDTPIYPPPPLPIPAAAPNHAKEVRITQAHLEMDTAKIYQKLFEKMPGQTPMDDECFYVDYNRAGTGLLEFVTAPDLTNGSQAADFLSHLQALLVRHKVTLGRFADGCIRVDANISLASEPTGLGTRVEIKNVNGTDNLRRAIDSEIHRQYEILAIENSSLKPHTRSFSVKEQVTVFMRAKETGVDYRFLPEPDLPVVKLTDCDIQRMQTQIMATEAAIHEEQVALASLVKALKPKELEYVKTHPHLHNLLLQIVADNSALADNNIGDSGSQYPPIKISNVYNLLNTTLRDYETGKIGILHQKLNTDDVRRLLYLSSALSHLDLYVLLDQLLSVPQDAFSITITNIHDSTKDVIAGTARDLDQLAIALLHLNPLLKRDLAGSYLQKSSKPMSVYLRLVVTHYLGPAPVPQIKHALLAYLKTIFL